MCEHFTNSTCRCPCLIVFSVLIITQAHDARVCRFSAAVAGNRPPPSPRFPPRHPASSRATPRVTMIPLQPPCCPDGRPTLPLHAQRSAPQPGATACWRPPANAKEIDNDYPQDIRASATDLLHHAMVSPIGWPSNYWPTQVHFAPTASMRGLPTTRECQKDRS